MTTATKNLEDYFMSGFGGRHHLVPTAFGGDFLCRPARQSSVPSGSLTKAEAKYEWLVCKNCLKKVAA